LAKCHRTVGTNASTRSSDDGDFAIETEEIENCRMLLGE
jgi:hypothetical protein